jgi:hypothetical protein
MTTVQWILVDDVAAFVSAAAWLATGVTAALRRNRLAFGLFAAAVLVSLARVATVPVLAGRGWWFVQEKVLLTLPLLAVAGVAAGIIAGPPLFAARRSPGRSVPAGALVSLFTAGYAALAGLMVTFLAGYPLTWSTALIAVSVVCAGAHLTARVLTAPAEKPAPEPGGDPVLPRRKFLGVAGGAIAAGSGRRWPPEAARARPPGPVRRYRWRTCAARAPRPRAAPSGSTPSPPARRPCDSPPGA